MNSVFSFSAYIFDMDGTLVDNMPFHTRAWVKLLAGYGLEISPDEFMRDTSGKINGEILRQYVHPQMSDAEILEAGERKEDHYRELYAPHLAPVAGLKEFLEKAKAEGKKLALGTAANEKNIEFILGRLGLETVFDAVVGNHLVPVGKPFPDIFLKCAELLGVPPQSCLVFEDAPAGIEAARRAGMKAAVVTTSLAAPEVQGIPHVIAVEPDFTRFTF